MRKEDKEVLKMYYEAVDSVIYYITDSTVIHDLDIIVNLTNDSNVDYLYNKISERLVELSNKLKVTKPKYLQ